MRQNRILEPLVIKAMEGDKIALNDLLESIQDYIYNVSIKILYHPENARDATQEILIKIITHLSSFNFESSFTTWTYRVATNYLLNLIDHEKRKQLSFEIFSKELALGLSSADNALAGGDSLLVEEVKIGCSTGMLQCLDNESRITYVLGEILEFDSVEGAYIQNITPETFRKRLSRARSRINAFTRQNCGLANAANACRCHRKVNHAVATGHVNPMQLLFASRELISSIAEVETAAELIQHNPNFSFPEARLDEIKKVLARNVI